MQIPFRKSLNLELKIALGLFVGALFLWCLGLGTQALRDWDEGTYSGVAREIYQTGNWLFPTLFGEPYKPKPPLLHWIIAFTYQLFGVSDTTSRLLPAALSSLAVPLTYFIGREIFPSQMPAVFSALVYLTLLPAVRHGRLAMHDGIALSAFLLLLLCLLKTRHDRRWALGAGISLGLIGFSKGVLMVLLGGIAGIFLLVEGQLLPLLKNPFFWVGLGIGEAPLVAWYAAQSQHSGFLQTHFQEQSLDRVWRSVENNTGPIWYYLLEILKYAWPWLLFWPGGLGLAWRMRTQSWGRLVLVGTIAYLGAVSMMQTKLPWYVMPVYPFVALAIGARLGEAWADPKALPKTWTAFLAFLGLASLGASTYIGWTESRPSLIAMGVVLAASLGLASWHSYHKNRQFIPVLLAGMYLTLGILFTSNFWLWELNEAFPAKPVGALVSQQVPPKASVYIDFAYGRPSLNYYGERPINPIGGQDLQQLWASRPYLLLREETLAKVQLPDSRRLGTAAGFTLVGP
ncbi:MAG: glycosyltransferase family 39 protein [Leptolyngbyaceae cyanobacterium bins.59]|nr:glycosyltransferase family 39 protein [Leptolyngbyaceae cyanobacterium bins.59]